MLKALPSFLENLLLCKTTYLFSISMTSRHLYKIFNIFNLDINIPALFQITLETSIIKSHGVYRLFYIEMQGIPLKKQQN